MSDQPRGQIPLEPLPRYDDLLQWARETETWILERIVNSTPNLSETFKAAIAQILRERAQ